MQGFTHTSLALAVLATLSYSTTANAQAAQELTPVVVTASSVAQPVQDVQASVQVIGTQELAGFSGSTVTEVLNRLATGVDARPNGSNSTVMIRGLLSNAGSPVLVLVDGLRRTTKYDIVNLNLFPIEDIERIEIVRGPMSALYGSDASGGVINLITRKPGAEGPVSGQVSLTHGSLHDGQRDTTLMTAGLSIPGQVLSHRFSVETRERGLYRRPGTPANDADQARNDHQFLSWQARWQLSPDTQLSWVLEGVEQKDSAPDLTARPPIRPFTNFERESRRFAALRLQTALGHGILAADLSQGHTEGSTGRSFPTIETTDFDQTQADLRYTLPLSASTWVFGTGQREDDLLVSILSQRIQVENQYAFAQGEFDLGGGWRALAGLRHDQFSSFGNALTPRLSVSRASGPWTVRLGYGEAFRAPSSLELGARFVRGTALNLGNPNLQPEENRTWELAIGHRSEALTVNWTLFDSQVDNLITTRPEARQPGDPTPPTGSRNRYVNLNKASIRGSELALNGTLARHWQWTAGWDALDAKDSTSGQRLQYTTRHTLRAGVSWQQGPWRADARGRYLIGYYASPPGQPAPPREYSNFGVADVKLAYQVNRAWTVAAGIDNLFDRQQPRNYGIFNAIQDPAERFVYFQTQYRF